MAVSYPKHGFNNLTYARLSEFTASSAVVLRLIHGYVAKLLQGWSSGRNLYITITDAQANLEICKITDIQGDSLTVARGQDGTVARNWPAGSLISERLISTNLGRIHQKGEYRSIDYNPNGVLAGAYPGEKVYETGSAACQKRWWLFNESTKWRLLAGEKCDWEYYDDDGYIYKAYMDFPCDDEDGNIRKYNSNWTTCRTSPIGANTYKADPFYSWSVCAFYLGGLNYIYRTFLYFNLAGATPWFNSAELHLRAIDTGGTGFTGISFQEGTQETPLDNFDYNNFQGAPYGTRLGYFDVDAGHNQVMSINAAFNAWGLTYLDGVVAADGVALLCLREDAHDFLNLGPWVGNYSGYFGIFYNEAAESDRPFIRLRYDT